MVKKHYKYVIGDWTLFPQSSEILNNQGSRLILTPKVIDTLVLLAEANGDVVLKGDLLDLIWKDTVVTNNSLNKVISELRTVFNDSRSKPKYIKTVHKKGYSLIVPISKIEIMHEAIKIKKSRKINIFLIIFSLIVISFIWFYMVESSIEERVLSPNGNFVASIKYKKSVYKLSVKNVLEDIEIKIDSFAQPESIAMNWSSNSENIIYNTTLKNQKYYSINIYNLKESKKNYIKFSKSLKDNIFDLYGDSLTSTFLNHNKIERKNDKVYYILNATNDTIKVLFFKDLIRDFKW